MAHLTSAPALRCARVVMGAFSLSVRPPETLRTGRLDGLTNSERHVATLVDHATNVHEVVALRPELRYWQRRLSAGTASAPQLAAFMRRMSDALSRVPRRAVGEECRIAAFASPTGFAVGPRRAQLSKWATEVSRVLFYYYDVRTIEGTSSDMDDRLRVAMIAETSLALGRVAQEVVAEYKCTIEDLLRDKCAELLAGRLTEADIRAVFRAVGVQYEKMPTYEQREEEAKLLA